MTSEQQSPSHEPDSRTVTVVFLALMLGMLLVSLAQTIFATTLPTLVGELGGVNLMSWVVTAYLLTTTISLPIYGQIGDQIGRKPLYLCATLIFLCGSTVGALAQSMEMMILARAIQGVGGGGLMVLSQAIIADVIPARRRGRYMGLMGAVFGFSSVIGPLLGGFFTDGPGWRWALWMNVPLSLITFFLAFRFLDIPRRGNKAHLDVLGFIMMSISTTSLILTTTWGGRDYAWNSPLIIGLITSTLVFGVLFFFCESKALSPIIPLDLFRNRNFFLCTLAGIVLGVTMFGTISYLPTYFQMVHHLSPTRAGLMMFPMMIGLMGTSTLLGNIISRTGRYKWYPVGGLFVAGIGLILMGRLETHYSLYHVGIILFIFGSGLGASMQNIVLMVQNSFPISRVGTATASNNFFRQIGSSLGAAAVGSFFAAQLQNLLPQRLSAALHSTHGDSLSHAPTGDYSEQVQDHIDSLTPGFVNTLPPSLHEAVVSSYNDALVPIFTTLAPLLFVASIILIFTKEEKLKERIE